MRVVVKRIGGCHRGLRFELDLPGAASGNAGTEPTAMESSSRDAPGLAELTSLIAKKTEIPEWAQRVFYQGRFLHGQGSLAEKGVPAEGAVLLLATSAHYREPTTAARAEPSGAATESATNGLAASSSSAATPAGETLAGGAGASSAGGSARAEAAPLPQRAPASLSPAPPAETTRGEAQVASGNASGSHVAASASSATADSSNAANSEDLSKLSVAELKQRLRDRGVSFEGCAEKSDLLDLLRNAPPRPALPNRPPQPKRPPPPLPEMLGPFGAMGMGNPPGFVNVGMGPFATGGVLNAGNTNAANLGVFLQQLGPAMDNAMNQAFAEVPNIQPARGDIGPAPEPPQPSPDSETNPQATPAAQPTAGRPQGQEVMGQPTITMSFPAGAPPTQAINAMMQQLGPQLQQMLGPFAQLFGEQNGATPNPSGEPQGPPAPQAQGPPAPR